MTQWKRTGDGEYPEEGQKCLIYFQHTGYSKSEFYRDYYVNVKTGQPDLSLGKTWGFSDKGGWLGEEDVLWMPVEASMTYLGDHPPIPDSYKNDKSFKKWDDPEKVYRYVSMREDFHYVRNPIKKKHINYWELDIPKGSKLGITCDHSWKNDGSLGVGEYVWQCIYDDGEDKHLVYISEEDFE